MYNSVPPVVGGGGVIGVLPATGLSLGTTVCAAVGFCILVLGLVLVRTARGGKPRFAPAEQ